MRAFLSLITVSFKTFLRDKLTLFFSIGFPFLFLFIFGFVFQSEETMVGSSYRFAYFLENADEEIVRELESIFGSKGSEVSSVDEGIKRLQKGELDAFVYISPSKAVFYGKDGNRDRLYYGDFVELMSRYNSSDVIPLVIEKNVKHSLEGREATSLDYTITGVIAISLLTTGMFSAISTFSVQRREGTLRRIRVTPVSGAVFVLSMASTRLIIGVFSTLTIILLSGIVFHANYQIRWIELFLATISGLISMLGLGALLSFIFRKPSAAQTAGTLVMTVMMFFSGVYFPLELLPALLRKIGRFLPTYYVALTIRYSTGLEFLETNEYVLITTLLTVFGVLLIVVAGIYSFRVEEI